MAPNMSKMLKEAQKLEKRFAAARDALKEMTVEGRAGGGAIRVTMNGQRDVLAVRIEPDVLAGADAAMVEDLLLAALSDAKQKSDELAGREMSKVTGGVLPPGAA